MRIISNFQDYMDGVQVYGMDKTITWKRVTKEIDRPDKFRIPKKCGLPMPHYLRGSFWWGEKIPVRGILGFCGKLYPVYLLIGSDDMPIEGFSTAKNFFAYVERLKQEDYNSGLEPYARVRKRNMRWYELGSVFTQPDIEYVFGNTKEDLDIFTEVGVPVFLSYFVFCKAPGVNKFILNPCLKELGFQSKVEPYTAYQELSMFIGGVLANNQDPPDVISDELKAHAHGFDKRSFRQDSPGKKAKRRQRRRK